MENCRQLFLFIHILTLGLILREVECRGGTGGGSRSGPNRSGSERSGIGDDGYWIFAALALLALIALGYCCARRKCGKDQPSSQSQTVTNKTPNQTVTNKTPNQTMTNKTPNQTVTNKTPNQTVTNKTPNQTAINKTPNQTATNKTPNGQEKTAYNIPIQNNNTAYIVSVQNNNTAYNVQNNNTAYGIPIHNKNIAYNLPIKNNQFKVHERKVPESKVLGRYGPSTTLQNNQQMQGINLSDCKVAMQMSEESMHKVQKNNVYLQNVQDSVIPVKQQESRKQAKKKPGLFIL